MAINREQCIEQYRARRAEGATNAEIAAEMGIKAGSLLCRLRRWGVASDRDNEAGPIEHGTFYGYNGRGCRCSECTEANRLQFIKSRAARKQRIASGDADFFHNASAYSNWGCRCEICCSAWTEKMSKAYARRKSVPFSELKHGRAATYVMYGCRCDDCKEASRRDRAARRSAS